MEQSTNPIYAMYILILSSHLHLGLLSGLFPSDIPTIPCLHIFSRLGQKVSLSFAQMDNVPLIMQNAHATHF
jgi:hypothetical protein